MNVVLNTNVFISAILWKGTPHKIIELTEDKIFAIITSEEILRELSGVIRRHKFTPYLKQANLTPQSVMESVISLVKIVHTTNSISVVKDDPSDNIFLSCALASGASFIISGDTHLLRLKSFANIPIVTPAQFLKTLN